MPLHSSYEGIHYRQFGNQGAWIVFFHGFCENMTLWESVLPNLEHHRVLLLDLPGFGHSSTITCHSLSEMGQHVEGLFQHLQITNPILLGHSMGGYLAAEMIKSGTVKAKGLGMVHSTFHADSDEKKQNRDKTISFLNDHPLDSFLNMFIEGLFAEKNTTNKAFINQAKNLVSQNNTDAVQATLLAMKNRSDSCEWLKSTDLPIMIISGRYDRHVPTEVSLSEIALCKRGLLFVLENSGHISQIEEPMKTKKFIEDFMEWVDDLQV
jgi:pimeloyl-ACP methyl ester carboxylesterase